MKDLQKVATRIQVVANTIDGVCDSLGLLDRESPRFQKELGKGIGKLEVALNKIDDALEFLYNLQRTK